MIVNESLIRETDMQPSKCQERDLKEVMVKLKARHLLR